MHQYLALFIHGIPIRSDGVPPPCLHHSPDLVPDNCHHLTKRKIEMEGHLFKIDIKIKCKSLKCSR